MKKLAFVTDIHLNEQIPDEADAQVQWKRILEDLAGRDIDDLIFGGDIGDASAYPWFFGTLKNTYPDFKLLVGNHDTYSEAIKLYNNPYLNNHPELYYTYEDETVKYIVLDSSRDRVSELQQEWLRKQLHTDKVIVLFIHHPVFGVDAAVDRQFPLHGREVIQEILIQSGKTVHIFCGHYHLPDEQVHGNISQSITPAASYQIRKEAQEIVPYTDYFAYRIISIDGDSISSELIFLQ